jgi:hypothetical protein
MRSAVRVDASGLLLGLLLCSASCTQPDHSLAEAIAAASSGPSGLVLMTDIAPFDWERLFIFRPYSQAAAVEQELGFSWSQSDRIEMLDRFALLVFVSDQRVVRFVEQPRDTDFVPCWRSGGFARAEARFRIVVDTAGARRCRLDAG